MEREQSKNRKTSKREEEQRIWSKVLRRPVNAEDAALYSTRTLKLLQVLIRIEQSGG